MPEDKIAYKDLAARYRKIFNDYYLLKEEVEKGREMFKRIKMRLENSSLHSLDAVSQIIKDLDKYLGQRWMKTKLI